MSQSARLSIPFLSAGQAQKEITHNEALQILDALVAPAIEGPPLAAPPTAPALGNCYLVGSAPTGAWVGQQGKLAIFTEGGWRMIAPVEGMTAFVRSTSETATYRAGAWEFGAIRGSALIIGGQQVAGAQRPAIASATGGATTDSQARATIDQILAALRSHGLIAN